MDPVAQSVLDAARDLGITAANRSAPFAATSLAESAIRRPRHPRSARCWPTTPSSRSSTGPLRPDHLALGTPYTFRNGRRCRSATSTTPACVKLSKDGQLALDLAEMKAIQAHFRELGREPTDVELETLAQTWSEHCSHKTLKGQIDFDGRALSTTCSRRRSSPPRRRSAAGSAPDDWCVSVFEDNAGVVTFDDELPRLLQGRDAQPPVGHRALRRREHRARRRHPRRARHRPGRQADLQHRRLLLRPARHAAGVAAAGRAAPAAGHARASSPACATTATAWASRPSTAPSASTSATSATRSSSAAPSA